MSTNNPTLIVRILFVLMVFLISCSEEIKQDINDYQIEFSFSINSSDSRLVGFSSPKSILISINGAVSLTKKKISVYSFGDSYVSEPVPLSSGTYELTEFLVLDENDQVIYVCPVSGSEKAYLVQNPLPITFAIGKDEVATVVPEVLAVDTNNPEDFGYASFSFDVVETFMITVMGLDSGKMTLLDSHLKVRYCKGEYEWDRVCDFDDWTLEAKTNTVSLRTDFDTCTLIVEKDGFFRYWQMFTRDSLLQYSSTPLLVVLEPAFTMNLWDYLGDINLKCNAASNFIIDQRSYSVDESLDFVSVDSGSNFSLAPYFGLNFPLFVSIKGDFDNITEFSSFVMGSQSTTFCRLPNLVKVYLDEANENEIDFSNNLQLESLQIIESEINKIDVRNCQKLEHLEVYKALNSEIDLSQNHRLKHIDAGSTSAYFILPEESDLEYLHFANIKGTQKADLRKHPNLKHVMFASCPDIFEISSENVFTELYLGGLSSERVENILQTMLTSLEQNPRSGYIVFQGGDLEPGDYDIIDDIESYGMTVQFIDYWGY